jgi:hypothetical protein
VGRFSVTIWHGRCRLLGISDIAQSSRCGITFELVLPSNFFLFSVAVKQRQSNKKREQIAHIEENFPAMILNKMAINILHMSRSQPLPGMY